jgi:AraC-like DNA-binding protein
MIQYTFYQPEKGLQPYISSYGLMELPEGKTSPLLSPPNGVTGFVIRISSDPSGEVVGQDFRGNPIANQPSYAIGQTTFPITGYMIGQISFLMIFFQPLGMYRFFGKNMKALTNRSVDLHEFLGHDCCEELLARLSAVETIEKKINILNAFFLRQKPTADEFGLVESVLSMIYESEGGIQVKTMEIKTRVSRRTMERHFLQKVGISPKVYAQIFRFKSAMNYLKANPGITWAGLAYNNGFFDQPHMIRYFKEYLKVSPNNLVSLDVDFINYLLRN